MYQFSPLFRSFAHWRAASTVIPLFSKATFTPSIQPNLGLPRTRPPLTSAISTLLAIRYSSILSTCPNHLNTLSFASALLADSLSIPALLRTSSFHTTHSWHSNQTFQTLHLNNIHFPSLSTSYTPCLCSQRRWYNYSLQRRCTAVVSALYFLKLHKSNKRLWVHLMKKII